MKPALIYYGGKQSLIKNILPLIPKHSCYCEPFAGGATVLFAKPKSSVEVINDTLDSLINFYRVLKNPETQQLLLKMCNETLYARSEHIRALELYKTGNPVEKAWSLWFKINAGFSGKLDGGFSTTKVRYCSPTVKFSNYKANLTRCAERIEKVQIENIDAIDCIKVYDSPETFFFVDPPYLDADQGHYKGYLPEDFNRLLNCLQDIEGKFLLTCYPGMIIHDYISTNEWSSLKIIKKIRAKNHKHSVGVQKEAVELLVWNYYQVEIQEELF